MVESRSVKLEGAGGVQLAADVAGHPEGPPLVLAHGGGQTRHSWAKSVTTLAKAGYDVTNLDLRGHGESDWTADYSLDAFAADIQAVCERRDQPAILVGASLGGLASLLLAGRRPELVAALVLVDVAPQVEPAGAQRIQQFMLSHAETGFASPEEAADAVAAYNPSRPRPAASGGLMKNLRLKADGRYYWHWDPKFLQGDRRVGIDQAGLERSAANVRCPVMLVRGVLSDVVSDRSVAELRKLIPSLEYVQTEGAAHMVAGDRNDIFLRDLQTFLDKHAPAVAAG